MKIFLTAFTFFLSVSCFAQEFEKKPPYKIAVTFTPTNFLATDGGIMVGGDYRITKSFGVSIDAGYIFYSYYMNELKGVTGINLRPALRYFVAKDLSNAYVQLQGLYKNINYSRYGWVGKDCVDDVPAYTQLQNYTYNKKVWGLNLMMGTTKRLFMKSNRFFLDAAVGAGIRHKTLKIKEQNCCIEEGAGPFTRKPERTTISLPINLKVAYKIY